MSIAEGFYYLKQVNHDGEQVYCYAPHDEQIVNDQAAQHAENNTVAEFPQHYPAEYHVKEGYQNECFVHSKETDGQTIQYFDDTLNRQKHQNQYGLTSSAAYAYDVLSNSQNMISQQSDDLLLPDNNYLHFSDKIDVPNFSEPQGQYVKDNMSSNYFTSASQEYDSLKSIESIKNEVQKLEAPSITVFPDYSDLYSESETKRILSLPLIKKDRLVPRNLRERIVYEIRVRNISKQTFAKNVLGRSPNIFNDMLYSSEEWDKLRKTRREQYEKMKEWLDMSEDQKKAAVRIENKDEKRTVFTREQREALKRHFEKFPKARKPELVGLADQLQLPWKVVARYFKNQRDRTIRWIDQLQ